MLSLVARCLPRLVIMQTNCRLWNKYCLSIQLITEPELPDYAESQIMPWGWNPAFRKRMLKGGIIERKLPTLDTLDAYRKKASRGLTIPLFALFEFNKVVSCTCGYHRMISGEGDHEFTDAAVKEKRIRIQVPLVG